MRDLVNIGEPAVPALIEAIGNASATAASLTGATTPEVAAANYRTLEIAGRIRQRAAIVLAELGDRRALPILKDLLKAGGPFEHGNIYVELAVGRLERSH